MVCSRRHACQARTPERQMSSDVVAEPAPEGERRVARPRATLRDVAALAGDVAQRRARTGEDRKSTRLNSSHMSISYAVFCLKKKKKTQDRQSENKRKARRTREEGRQKSRATAYCCPTYPPPSTYRTRRHERT